MNPENEELSFSDLRDWAMDIAGPAGQEFEKSELLSLIRAVVAREPESAEAQFSLGFAIYHLYREAASELVTQALEALRRAQTIDPQDPWAPLYEIYVLWQCRNLHACVAACACLDRSAFRSSKDWAWRAISVDEIEFAALVELGFDGERIASLADDIVNAAESEQSGMFPFVPGVFLRSLDIAVDHALLTPVAAASFRARLSPPSPASGEPTC